MLNWHLPHLFLSFKLLSIMCSGTIFFSGYGAEKLGYWYCSSWYQDTVDLYFVNHLSDWLQDTALGPRFTQSTLYVKIILVSSGKIYHHILYYFIGHRAWWWSQQHDSLVYDPNKVHWYFPKSHKHVISRFFSKKRIQIKNKRFWDKKESAFWSTLDYH